MGRQGIARHENIMKVIVPLEITDDIFWGSNVAETDYSEWAEGSTYGDGDNVIISSHSLTATVGSAYLASHRGNFIDGNAFFIIDSTDLSLFEGDDVGNTPYKITLTDSAGKTAVGYIAAGGNGLRYSLTLIDDGSFSKKETASSPWTRGAGWSLATAKAVSTNGELLYQDANLVEWQLYRASIEVTAYTSGKVSLYYGSSTNDFNERTSATTFYEYAMSDGGSENFGANGFGASALTIDNLWVKEVLEPPKITSGGIHIVSERNGLYRAWASIESGFDPREIATYLIEKCGKNYHTCYESLKGSNTGNFPPQNLTGGDPYWKELESTNRWQVFDDKINSQTTGTTVIRYVLQPGAIDSVAFFNLDATTVDIILSDPSTDVVTNGTGWTGATGTTQPNNWDKVGTPSDFTIDSGWLKLTVDGASEGISQTETVLAATEYQLLGKYKNTAGDLAQYAVYDVTHSADILVTTDLTSSTTEAPISYVFTTPAGCTSVKISLLGKTASDIVWFDSISLSKTLYSETITLSGDTEAVKLDVTSSATGILTLNVNKSGAPGCGEIVIGTATDIGTTLKNMTISMMDFSTKSEDEWGDQYITVGDYAWRASYDLMIANASIETVYNFLALYKSDPLVWVADTTYTATMVYGYFRDFDIVIAYPNYSDCAIEVEGLT